MFLLQIFLRQTIDWLDYYESPLLHVFKVNSDCEKQSIYNLLNIFRNSDLHTVDVYMKSWSHVHVWITCQRNLVNVANSPFFSSEGCAEKGQILDVCLFSKIICHPMTNKNRCIVIVQFCIIHSKCIMISDVHCNSTPHLKKERRLFHTSAKCVIWIIIWIAHFELRSVHTREVTAIFDLCSVHTRDRIWDLAFRSGRRMSGYPANQTCTELAFPLLLCICSARYIGGSGSLSSAPQITI